MKYQVFFLHFFEYKILLDFLPVIRCLVYLRRGAKNEEKTKNSHACIIRFEEIDIEKISNCTCYIYITQANSVCQSRKIDQRKSSIDLQHGNLYNF